MKLIRLVFNLLRSLTLRCPNCHRDLMARNPYVFHRQCSHCGLVYQADEGDFWGSVVFSYTFAGISGLTVAGLLNSWSSFDWESILYISAGAAIASILLFYPFAKSLWVYTLFHTRGQYEEFRARGGSGE